MCVSIIIIIIIVVCGSYGVGGCSVDVGGGGSGGCFAGGPEESEGGVWRRGGGGIGIRGLVEVGVAGSVFVFGARTGSLVERRSCEVGSWAPGTFLAVTELGLCFDERRGLGVVGR